MGVYKNDRPVSRKNARRQIEGTLTAPTVVEKTAEAIAFGIVSGKHAAGERLPSVRKLASQFGINPSTVQVVLGRLQSSGFVSPHPGLGFVVRDIERFGGIGTWRYVFRFAQQLPDRATRAYADLLEMRRVLIEAVAAKIADDNGRHDSRPVRRAIERFELLLATDPRDQQELARAELDAIRLLVLATGQSVVTAVLNSIAEIYLEVPAALEAMYTDAPAHLAVWQPLLLRWERGELSDHSVSKLSAFLREYDATVVERFRRIVSSPEHAAAVQNTPMLK